VTDPEVDVAFSRSFLARLPPEAALVVRDFRQAGVVTTSAEAVVIVDVARLYAESGRTA
jgi:hypothetical protein